jgi:hypothetical protein
VGGLAGISALHQLGVGIWGNASAMSIALKMIIVMELPGDRGANAAFALLCTKWRTHNSRSMHAHALRLSPSYIAHNKDMKLSEAQPCISRS